MREATINRNTTETEIYLSLTIEGTGRYDIETGCGFLNHMLELFTKHGNFNLALECKGDIDVDYHHTVEDIGIVLGQALSNALGDCRGIKRYASSILPMDEALLMVAVDVSGRTGYFSDLNIPSYRVGDFDVELVDEFFTSFCRNAGLTLHIRQMCGTNAHHIIEAAFKGFARALKEAVSIDSSAASEIPSTKGRLKEL